MEHLIRECPILGATQLIRFLTIDVDGSNIGKKQSLVPFLLNQHPNTNEKTFTKIKFKLLKKGMPLARASPTWNRKS